jgi:hypothetical protein
VKVVNDHDGSKLDEIGPSSYMHSTSSRGTSGGVKRRKGNLDIDLNVLPIGQSSPTPAALSPKNPTASSLHSLMQPAHSTLLRQPTSPAEARSPTHSTLSSAGKSKKTNSLDIDLNETHPIDPSQQMSPVNTLHQSTTTSNSKTLSNVSPTNSNTGVLDGVEEPKQKSILKEKRIITASHNLNVPRTPHDEVSTVIDDALLTSKSSNSEHASKHPPNDLTKFDSFNGIHKLHNDRMANFDLNLPEQSTKPINGLHMDIYKKHMHQPVVAHRNQEHQLLETNALGQHPHDAHHDEARREEVDILNAHHVEVPTLEAHHSEGHNVEEYLVEPHPVKPHSVEGHHDETQHVHSHTIDGDPPKAHRPAEAHNKVEQIGHHPLDAHHVDAHREEAETLDARIVEVPTTFDELHVEAVKNKPHSVEGHHEETHHVQSQIIEGDPPEAQRPVEDHNKVEVHQPSQIDTEKTHHDVNQPNKSDHFEGRREEAHFPEVHHVETNHVEIHPNKPNPVEKQPVEQHLPVQNTIEARQKVHKNQPEEMDIGFKSPKPMVKTPTLFEKDQPLDEHQTVGTQQTKEAYKPLEEQHIEAVQALEAQNLEKQRTFEPQYPVETRLHSELPHSIKVRQSSAAAHQADKSHQSVDLDGAHHPVEVHHTNEASKHGESHQPAMKHQINGVQKLTIEAHQPAYLPNEAHNLRNEEQLIKTKHHVKSDQLTEGSRPMETRHSVDAQLPIRETHQPAEAHQPVNVPQTVEKHLRSEGQHPIESRQQPDEIHDVNQHVDDPTSEAHHPLGAQHPPEAERDLGAHQNIEAHQPLEAIHQKSKPTQRATGHGESSQSLEGHHLIQSNRIFEPHPHKTQIEEEHGKEKTSQTSDSKNPKYIHKDETINSGASRHSVESSHSLGVSHSDEPQQLLGLPFASTSLINWGMYMQPSKTIGNPSIEELLRVSQRHFDRHNRFFDRAHSRRLSQDLNEMPEPPREQQGNRQGETNENHSSTSHKEDNTTEKLHQNAHHMESDAVDKTAGEAHQRKPAGEASKPKKSHHPNEARRPGACSN